MSILCRIGYHRRLGRSVRSIAGGYHGFCRDCGIGMTKPWTKRWRVATVEETLERQREADRAASSPQAPALLAAGTLPKKSELDGGVRRRVARVKPDPPAPSNGYRRMFPKSHRRKLEEADVHRRAIDLAFYLIRDHGDGAEAALAERMRQPGLTSADRKRLKATGTALAERRKRDRGAKAASDPAGA